jgi:transposase
MNPRELRGLEIAARYKLTHRGKIWTVPSQSGKLPYTVDLGKNPPACSCPDNEVNRQHCKHIIAVEITIERRRGGKKNNLSEPAAAKTKKPTYKQAWKSYNAAQTNEKELLQTLLYDLCQKIEEPVQTLGRPRASLRDMVFSATFKVYSTVSGRRFASDLKEAQKKGHISKAPHHNTVFKYLELEYLTPILRDLIMWSSLPLKAIETDFAVDSSGFSTCGKSVTWFNTRYGHEQDNRDWLKLHLMTGVTTNIVTSVEISGRHANDSPYFKPLVKATAKNFKLREVSADKAYSSRANLCLVKKHKAMPYIAFKKNAKESEECKVWTELFHYYSLHREEFLTSYHKRSNAESTFNMVKAKFGERLRSKTDTAQINEALCKVLCHNICCVIQSMYELGVEPNFQLDIKAAKA